MVPAPPSRHRRAVVTVAVAVSMGLLVGLPGIAGAAFPAINGPIVFQSSRAATGNGCLYSGTSELFTTSAGGGPVSQLDCTGSTDQHPFASPDGTEVIFASNRQDGVDFELYTMPLSTDGSATGTPVDVSQDLPSGGSDDYPSWAPAAPGEQDRIIFDSTRDGGQPELYTEDLDAPGSVAPVFSQIGDFSDTEPVYDPSDADEIAFVRTSDGGRSQIYTYNVVTRSLVDLSAANGDGTSDDSKPDFAPSPDSSGTQLLVFQSDRPTGGASNGPCAGTQLYTMSDRVGPTSSIAPVFQQMSGSPPEPDGVQVCATSKGAQGVAAGTKVAVENPVFSPDGTEVAFDQLGYNGTGNTQDVFTAYSAPLSGGVARIGNEDDLTPNFATDEAPSWAPVSPGASTPEVPDTLLLPVTGGGVIGGAVLLTRRRRRTADGSRP
jgi:Tol biopolymer transport system component